VLARDHDVIAISRHPPTERGDPVRWLAADATSPADLDRALHGVEVVYHLVHSLGSKDFEHRDRLAADTVAAAAERAGVRQIIFLGGLADETLDLSPHLRSRAETARRLAARGVPVTTVRTAIIVAKGSAAFDTIVALVDRLPAMVCPRWVSTRTQPIAMADVVGYLAAIAGRAETFGRAFDAPGPETMTYRDMIERIASVHGHRPLIVEVPFLTPRLSSLWLYLVTPVEASVARQLVDGLRNETVAGGQRIGALVPLELTPFDEAVRTALAADRDH
jgi:uncharacterized protein YbjT (DUF2867 family)